jgi:hypothetical protein
VAKHPNWRAAEAWFQPALAGFPPVKAEPPDSRKFLWHKNSTLLHSRTLLRAGLLDSVAKSESARGETSFTL